MAGLRRRARGGFRVGLALAAEKPYDTFASSLIQPKEPPSLPPIVCGILSIVLILAALGSPASAAETLLAGRFGMPCARRSRQRKAAIGRALTATASTITDPLPLKMLHWMGLCPPRRPGPVSRHLRVHRKEPGLAGAEGPAQTCRGGFGRRIGRGRRRLVQTPSADQPDRQDPRSGDHDQLGRSRGRQSRRCGPSGSPPILVRSTKRIFLPATRPRFGPRTMCYGSTGCCGTAKPRRRAGC